MSELSADSVAECRCPVIRTDVISRHTAVLHWQRWCRVVSQWHCTVIQHT